MRRLLVLLYGKRPSRPSAFLAGVARLGNPAPRLSLARYEEYVAERESRIRTSPSAAFLQSGRHFESAEAELAGSR